MSLSSIKHWISRGDLDRLEHVVLEGKGARLLGEHSSDLRTRVFLRGLPNYLAKISQIHDAVTRGSLGEVQRIVDSEPKKKLVIAKDSTGIPLIHKAVFYDHPNILDWILDNYPSTVDQKDREGRTALYYCAACRYPETVWDRLIEAGCDASVIDKRKHPAAYYLHRSAEIELPVPTKMPVKKHKKHKDPSRWMNSLDFKPSNIRIWIHNKDIGKLQHVLWEGHGSKLRCETSSNVRVKRFLEAVPFIMGTIKDIHQLVIKNDIDGFRMKMDEPIPPIILCSKDSNGLNVLHKAAGLGYGDMAREILERYPVTVNLPDNEGRTPLHYAAVCRDGGQMYDLLCEFNADETRTDNKQKIAAYYKNRPSDIDLTNLVMIPEAPRVSSTNYPRHWDWRIIDSDLPPRVKRTISNNSETNGNNNDDDSAFGSAESAKELTEEDVATPEIENAVDELNGNDEEDQAPKEAENDENGGEIVENGVEDEEKANVEDESPNADVDTADAAADNDENENPESNVEDNEPENKEEENEEEEEAAGEIEADDNNNNEEPQGLVIEEIDENNEGEQDEAPNGDDDNVQEQEDKKEEEETPADGNDENEAPPGEEAEEEAPVDDNNNNNEEEAPADDAEEETTETAESDAKDEEEQQQPQEDEAAPAVEEKGDDDEEGGNKEAGEENPEGTEEEEADDNREPSTADSGVEDTPQDEVQTDDPADHKDEAEAEDGEEDEEEGEGEETAVEEEHQQQQEEEGEGEEAEDGMAIDEETDELVETGNMEQLAALVLTGEGHRLVGRTSSNPELQAFIENVPSYMAKIRAVHKAAREGNLKDLQISLDRRKFAIAKDPSSPHGATPLHVAVIFGHTPVVRYLAGRFPETAHALDLDGRTPLHYASVLADNGHYYNLLLHLGANPLVQDNFGQKADYYKHNQEDLSHKQLLRDFGASESLADEMLVDKDLSILQDENGKYLASSLGNPLMKGLTEVATNRPNDPVAYLATYLYNFASKDKPEKEETEGENETAENEEKTENQGEANVDNNDDDNDDGYPRSPDLDGPGSLFAETERDENGQSSLHFAANRTHPKDGLYHLLQERQINIAYRDTRYRTGRDIAEQSRNYDNVREIDRFVVYLAARGETDKLVELLLEGYDHILDTEDEGKNIVRIAEEEGNESTVKFLKSLKNYMNLRDEIHRAIRRGDGKRVRELLQKNGDGARLLALGKNSFGRCSLHIAVLREDIDVVSYIAKSHPETLRIGDNLERTPLHYAMGVPSVEELSGILIRAGAIRVQKDLKSRQPTYYFMNRTDIKQLQDEEDALAYEQERN